MFTFGLFRYTAPPNDAETSLLWPVYAGSHEIASVAERLKALIRAGEVQFDVVWGREVEPEPFGAGCAACVRQRVRIDSDDNPSVITSRHFGSNHCR